MAASVTAPVGQAINKTVQILFKPFDIGKWFVMGFCAWLAYLGQGGGNIQFPGGGGGGSGSGGGTGVPGPGGGSDPDEFLRQAGQWISANLGMVIVLGLLVLVLIVGITLALTWLRSRGAFMFIDGIILNRGAVREPWTHFRMQGNSLFKWSVVFMIICGVVFVLIVGLALLIAWTDIQARRFESAAVLAIVIGGILLFFYAVIAGVIGLLLNDFVVPIMYLLGERAVPAWRIFLNQVLPGQVVPIILFYLMRIVLGIAQAVIALIVTCATCCLAALPYLGTVILLPLFVFSRCYSLYMLEQLHPEWKFFMEEPPPSSDLPLVEPVG